MTTIVRRLRHGARIAILALALTYPLTGHALEPTGQPASMEALPGYVDAMAAELGAVDRAILHLMELNPTARVVVDAEYRGSVVAAIVGAAYAHDVPALLLTTIAFRESTFDHAATGARGELGITQVMPRWEQVIGCDLSTLGGQVDCSARMLARFHRTCKGWPGALTLYATGKGCATGPFTTRRIASRITLWQALERL